MIDLPTYWAAVEAGRANWASINFGVNVANPLIKFPAKKSKKSTELVEDLLYNLKYIIHLASTWQVQSYLMPLSTSEVTLWPNKQEANHNVKVRLRLLNLCNGGSLITMGSR